MCRQTLLLNPVFRICLCWMFVIALAIGSPMHRASAEEPTQASAQTVTEPTNESADPFADLEKAVPPPPSEPKKPEPGPAPQPVQPPAAAEAPSQPKPLAARRPFELTILGPDSKPVPNIAVEFRTKVIKPEHVLRGAYSKRGRYGVYILSDAKGVLLLTCPVTPGNFNLYIEQPGYAPYWAEWNRNEQADEIPESFTIRLGQAWTVGGVVVDEQGKPIAGATVDPSVKFDAPPGSMSLGVGTELKTDVDGKWSYNCIPASMNGVNIAVDHPDWMPERRSLSRSIYEVRSGEQPTATIPLKRGITITGTVTDESGTPIAGARVKAFFLNEPRSATTDAKGVYKLNGCEPTKERIVVSAQGRAMDMREVEVQQNMPSVDFVMKPGGKIRVRILDQQGQPIPKGTVFFQQWRGQQPYREFERLNHYANKEGIWEWNEAPLDELQADIGRPSGMHLGNQPLVAREEEYVFRIPPDLIINGKVVDAETDKAIEKFRVIPGYRRNEDQFYWNRFSAFQGKKGSFTWRPHHQAIVHGLRIEADGYQVTESREVQSDEGTVQLTMELKRAENLSAQILTPDGKPASGADLALGVPDAQISVQNGAFDRQTFATRYAIDDAGRFSFPQPKEDYELVIVHPTGFANYKSETPLAEQITLTPWARVEGVARFNGKPVPSVELGLNPSTSHAYDPNKPRIFTRHVATTDEQGRFVFERVYPGDATVSLNKWVENNPDPAEAALSQGVRVQCESGKTTQVNLGDAK
jgi:uncharacterized GH25 family protein